MFKYSNNPIKNVICPFCLNNTGLILYKVTNYESTLHFVRPWYDEVKYKKLCKQIEALWGQSSCEIVKCDHCEGVFSWPFVPGDEIFYKIIQHESAKYPQDKWEFTGALSICNNNYPLSTYANGLRILEIGAGDGAFIRKLISEGVPPEVICATEYGQHQKAKIAQISDSIKVGGDELLENLQDKRAGQFSHIFLFQVLNSIGYLDKYFNLFRDLLKAPGVLFFSIPNDFIIEFSELNGLELYMPPCYIARFSKKAIQQLGQRYGFSAELILDEPFNFIKDFRRYLISCYLRQSQVNNTFANLLDMTFKRKHRKFGMMFFGLMTSPVAIIKTMLRPRIGSSRLAVLRKLAG